MNARARTAGPVAAALLLAALALTGSACSDDDGADDPDSTSSTARMSITITGVTAPEGITEEEAIDIARRHQEDEDPEFDFAATRPVVIDTGDEFDVGFPDAEPTGPGGEPHVVVDQTTGEVTDSYLTR
jgi:hypothetical protein